MSKQVEVAESTTAPVPYDQQGVFKKLTLDQIALDSVTDVRDSAGKDEAEKIDKLARSIFETGQIQPILVRPDGSPDKYLLIAGRRRLAAHKLIEAKTKSIVTIDAIIVKKTDDEAYATALQENLQRKQFSPIEVARNIQEIRKKFNWNGDDWSAHVAEFLKVSRATVTQLSKLLNLPKDIQNKVHRGDLSAQSAFDLYSVEEAKREQVLKEAEKLAEEEAAQKPVKKQAAGKGKDAKAKDAEPEEKGKVKRKHVLEAARRTEALTETKPRTRNEIIAFFQEILDSTDPYPEPISAFCATLINKWATGVVGDRALLNKLDTLAEIVADKQKKTAPKKREAIPA